MHVLPASDETNLVELLQSAAVTHQEWARRAACQEPSTEMFFGDQDDPPPAEAMAACRSCPVADECLATALLHESVDDLRSGWWGGRGPEDRGVLWARIGAPATPAATELDMRDPAALARHLRSQRRTIPSIAAELGCSKRTVYRYLAASAA